MTESYHVNKHKTSFVSVQNICLCDNKKSALTGKVVRHSQQMFKMCAICSDTSTEALMQLLHCVADDTLAYPTAATPPQSGSSPCRLAPGAPPYTTVHTLYIRTEHLL